jgi:hypothetical protein
MQKPSRETKIQAIVFVICVLVGGISLALAMYYPPVKGLFIVLAIIACLVGAFFVIFHAIITSAKNKIK